MGFIQEQGSYTSLFCLFNAAFKRYVISFLAVSTLSRSRYLFLSVMQSVLDQTR